MGKKKTKTQADAEADLEAKVTYYMESRLAEHPEMAETFRNKMLAQTVKVAKKIGDIPAAVDCIIGNSRIFQPKLKKHIVLAQEYLKYQIADGYEIRPLEEKVDDAMAKLREAMKSYSEWAIPDAIIGLIAGSIGAPAILRDLLIAARNPDAEIPKFDWAEEKVKELRKMLRTMGIY
ncbi:MAG: hypothetical protein DRP85_04095 [Candidatus Makaraimicrobium thalassicum]|nr:MAG: hypothetical protein DRP85_04095 [Candidatus Omnitrophota bacterium]